MDVSMITTWMGRDINELSKEELIKALEHSVKESQCLLQHVQQTAKLRRLIHNRSN